MEWSLDRQKAPEIDGSGRTSAKSDYMHAGFAAQASASHQESIEFAL